MHDVIDKTLVLLSVNKSNEVSAIHLLSIVDPKATWFNKWMVSV